MWPKPRRPARPRDRSHLQDRPRQVSPPSPGRSGVGNVDFDPDRWVKHENICLFWRKTWDNLLSASDAARVTSCFSKINPSSDGVLGELWLPLVAVREMTQKACHDPPDSPVCLSAGTTRPLRIGLRNTPCDRSSETNCFDFVLWPRPLSSANNSSLLTFCGGII